MVRISPFPKRKNVSRGVLRKAVKRKRTQKVKERIGYSIGHSSLGKVLVASCEMGILAVFLGRNREILLQKLQDSFPDTQPIKGEWESDRALACMLDFIRNPCSRLDWPVFLKGTHFQQRVWRAVQEIPAGETATYKDIARKIGAPRAMRAVGSACSACSLFLIVPCHRVLRSDHCVSDRNHRDTTCQRMLLEWEAKTLQTSSALKV